MEKMLSWFSKNIVASLICLVAVIGFTLTLNIQAGENKKDIQINCLEIKVAKEGMKECNQKNNAIDKDVAVIQEKITSINEKIGDIKKQYIVMDEKLNILILRKN